jgi:hypothetical protein
MGVADPNKLVKMGWSAGGHMTNKMITFHRSLQGGEQRRRRGELDLDVCAERSPRVPHAVVRRHAVAGQCADRSVLEQLAAEGRVEGEDADDLPGRRAGSAGADAAVGRDVSRAEVERRADPPVCGAARGHGWTELRHRLFKLQIEMEWFEKYINNRAYVWEKVPGDEKKEPARPTTTAGVGQLQQQ